MTAVGADAWVATHADLYEQGFAYLDLLAAIDRADDVELVAHVMDPATLAGRFLSTRTAHGGRAASLTGIYPCAAWHEREIAEMFGVEFAGHPDPRPLLLRDRPGRPPLLKAAVLAARVVDVWPGAAEPVVDEDGRRAGNPSRRTQQPPGAPADWLKSR